MGGAFLSLKLACALVRAKIRKISRAIEGELESTAVDMTDAEWDAEVAQPCKKLVDDMEILSEHFGPIAICSCAFPLFGIPTVNCLSQSPFGSTLPDRGLGTYSSTIFYVFMCVMLTICVYFPYNVISGPAGVSTEADHMLMKLNAIRMHDLSHDVHQRVYILETALNNINNMQGVGFEMLGIVVNRRLLRKVVVQMWAAGAFMLPILLTLVEKAKTVNTDCAARAIFANSTCSFDAAAISCGL